MEILYYVFSNNVRRSFYNAEVKKFNSLLITWKVNSNKKQLEITYHKRFKLKFLSGKENKLTS